MYLEFCVNKCTEDRQEGCDIRSFYMLLNTFQKKPFMLLYAISSCY